VQDAKRHGVEVRRVDVMRSDWDCTLEGLPHPPAVRLGLRMVVGLKAESALRILKARRERPFDGAEDLAKRADVEQHEMTLLASGRPNELGGLSAAAVVGGGGAALGAAALEARAGRRGGTRTTSAARGRGGGVGLRGYRFDAAPASTGDPAASASPTGMAYGRQTA
jgi:Helix-hairpin-helix motif